MTMKKTFAILLILFSSSFLVAQELMEVPLTGIDSMKQISPSTEPWMMSPNLSYPMIGKPSDFMLSSEIRDFDFSKWLSTRCHANFISLRTLAAFGCHFEPSCLFN